MNYSAIRSMLELQNSTGTKEGTGPHIRVLSTSEMKTAKEMEGDNEALMRGDYESSKNAGVADFIAYTKAYGGTFHIIAIVFLFMGFQTNVCRLVLCLCYCLLYWCSCKRISFHSYHHI